MRVSRLKSKAMHRAERDKVEGRRKGMRQRSTSKSKKEDGRAHEERQRQEEQVGGPPVSFVEACRYEARKKEKWTKDKSEKYGVGSSN